MRAHATSFRLEKTGGCDNLRETPDRPAAQMGTADVTTPATTATVRDNTVENRFELAFGHDVAFASYRRLPGRVVITHTETPRHLRGRGVATQLVKGALEIIRADGDKVVAGCGFVADYLDGHPEYADLAK